VQEPLQLPLQEPVQSIVGAVADGFGHPVAGARVRCGKAGTTSRSAGSYSLAASRRKSCRVVATPRGFSATSRRTAVSSRSGDTPWPSNSL